jgi:hypothetical protein
MPAQSRLAQLIAHNEGFPHPGEIPTVRNNPMDLKHGPHASHPPTDPNGIGWYAAVDLGWQDGERQLQLFAKRGLTLLEMVNEYLGFAKDALLDESLVDGNNRVPYLDTICTGLNLPPTALVSEALTIPSDPPAAIWTQYV